jgi:hypothetical protein
MVETTGDEASGPAGPDPLNWVRATLSAIVILVAGAALLMFGPNWLLSHLSGLTRNGRVAVATSVFFVAFVALAWILRRLQARRVI